MHSNQVLFASLPRRIKAGIIDGFVLFILFIVCPLIIVSIAGHETGLNALAMYLPPLLLEPFLITFLGFTLGQYIFGIRVIRVDTGRKCPLLTSFARYYLKFLLGGLSMAYMLFNNKHQAIHDRIAKTLVVLSQKKIEKNPAFAEYGEIEQQFDNDIRYIYPSPLRRFGIFCVWILVATVAYVIFVEVTALLMIPGYTLDTERLPRPVETAANVIYSIMFIAMAIMASKGCLPGAKKKKKEVEVMQEESIEEKWF